MSVENGKKQFYSWLLGCLRKKLSLAYCFFSQGNGENVASIQYNSLHHMPLYSRHVSLVSTGGQ
jgi:hypothetical protein